MQLQVVIMVILFLPEHSLILIMVFISKSLHLKNIYVPVAVFYYFFLLKRLSFFFNHTESENLFDCLWKVWPTFGYFTFPFQGKIF